MNDNGFFKVSRSISRHPSVLSAPHPYRTVLTTILDYMCFKEMDYDDHGQIIHLNPNQFICSIRQLAEYANVSKNDVERALTRFSRVKILRQEVRHKKTVITIEESMIYESEKIESETNCETKVRHKQEGKNIKNDKETTTIHEKSVVVFSCLFDLEIPEEEKVWATENFNEDDVINAIAYVKHPKTKINKSLIQAFKWACTAKPQIPKSEEDIIIENKNYAHDILCKSIIPPGIYMEKLNRYVEIGTTNGQPCVFEYEKSNFKQELSEALKKYRISLCTKA